MSRPTAEEVYALDMRLGPCLEVLHLLLTDFDAGRRRVPTGTIGWGPPYPKYIVRTFDDGIRWEADHDASRDYMPVNLITWQRLREILAYVPDTLVTELGEAVNLPSGGECHHRRQLRYEAIEKVVQRIYQHLQDPVCLLQYLADLGHQHQAAATTSA